MAKFSKYIAGKFFSESQQRILRDCINANREEYTQWMVTNVTIPAILILVPVFLYYLIKSDITDPLVGVPLKVATGFHPSWPSFSAYIVL